MKIKEVNYKQGIIDEFLKEGIQPDTNESNASEDDMKKMEEIQEKIHLKLKNKESYLIEYHIND